MKMHFGKKIGSLLLTVLLAASLASCSTQNPLESSTAPSSEEAQDSASKELIRVGFAVQDLTNTYFLSVIDGINDHKDEYGVELLVHDGKSDASSQVTAIENFVTQGVDAIVICPIDTNAPEAAIKEAQAAGIPVISWSELVAGSDAFLTLKQHDYGYTAGKIAGEWAKESFENEPDAQVMFVFVPEVEALAERGQGLKDGFLEIMPNATIVAEQAGNTPEAGMKAVETTLTKYPDLNVVVCCNDAVALGAYEAMAAAGKKAGETCIVGLDATDEALRKIKEDSMLVGTVDIGAYDQGVKFLDLVMDVLQNGPKAEPVYVDFIPVTRDNINEYFK